MLKLLVSLYLDYDYYLAKILLFDLILFYYGFFPSGTSTVQNNNKGISNSIPSQENSKTDILDSSLLNPANAIADIDTFCFEEGLEVNII